MGGYMLTKTLVVYSMCSLLTYILCTLCVFFRLHLFQYVIKNYHTIHVMSVKFSKALDRSICNFPGVLRDSISLLAKYNYLSATLHRCSTINYVNYNVADCSITNRLSLVCASYLACVERFVTYFDKIPVQILILNQSNKGVW